MHHGFLPTVETEPALARGRSTGYNGGMDGSTGDALTASGLLLDASRADVLAYTARLVEDAWRSFDRARPGQPPVDRELRALLSLALPESGAPVARGLEEAARILDESLSPNRPRYFAFVGSSGLEIGVLGDALAACYDVNLATEAAAANLVEMQALRWAGEFVGYPATTGAFTSGGMVSNLTALAAARERALPGARAAGLRGRRAALYCSADAHYSVCRAAELLGIGSEGLRLVAVDARRAMRVDATAAAIERDRAAGVVPVAVVATAGTTLTGAVDPIGPLADLCAAHGIWLHVDGAYGLPAASAPSTAHLFRHLERADSVAIDAHKWLYLPKACSVVLVRDPATLAAAFAHDAAYIPHEDDEVNPVDWTLEYSRPFRALKLWLALRVHGAAAFRAAIERNLAQAQLLAEEVRRHADLELLLEPELTVVPFRHRPPRVADLDRHNLELAQALRRDGRVFVAAAVVDGVAWLRPCIVNYRTQDEDVLALVAIAREVGNRLARAESTR
jgi:aromatic-L-amino-acid decarboxylase